MKVSRLVITDANAPNLIEERTVRVRKLVLCNVLWWHAEGGNVVEPRNWVSGFAENC